MIGRDFRLRLRRTIRGRLRGIYRTSGVGSEPEKITVDLPIAKKKAVARQPRGWRRRRVLAQGFQLTC